MGQKGNESQAKKNPHKLLENLCPTKKKNGKSLVLISKAPEKKRERERERWSSMGAAFLHATQINDFIAPNQNPKIVFLV